MVVFEEISTKILKFRFFGACFQPFLVCSYENGEDFFGRLDSALIAFGPCRKIGTSSIPNNPFPSHDNERTNP